ncbi:MAG TPA: LysR family transcriptional regulator [Xanthobacteraceae bacterium]|nr:LysR family transcriptional regulator [Xanthobacteraceae bacterium]
MNPQLGSHPFDMTTIRQLRIFIAVVETQSFTAAARQLHLGVPTVSKSIATLESDLGSPLIYRNTRRISVTETGERFYRHCLTVMDAINASHFGAGSEDLDVRGHLRVVASPSFSTAVLSPMLPSFLRRYPQITVEVIVNSGFPNLIRDQIDVAILLRNPTETKAASLRLAPNALVLCASPAYLKERGVPKMPADLQHHHSLVSLRSGAHDPLMIHTGRRVELIQIPSVFASDNGNVIKRLCLDGLGIANLYRFHVHRELEQGTLIELFPGSQPDIHSIYAVFPHHKEMMGNHTMAFVNALQETIGSPPYWSAKVLPAVNRAEPGRQPSPAKSAGKSQTAR